MSAPNTPVHAGVGGASENHARRHFYQAFAEYAFREERLFLAVSIFIGIISGLAVVCFRVAIEWSRLELLGSGLVPAGRRMLLAPVLVSFIVAALVIWVFPAVRGSGVNQTKAALYIYNGYIPFRTAIGKFVTAALAIGSGHSLGPEDPSLQIGAALASALGRSLRFSRERLRLIAPVGAAAGLAAAFNAPISAVLFVIEEVIGRWSAGILGAVVLSAVSSVVVERGFLGAEPLFRIPPVELIRPQELIAYAVLGVVGGLASLVFVRLIGLLRPRLKALPRWTQYLQPSIAGLIIGLIGVLGAPQVMGAGYEYIDLALHDQFTWKMLGVLAGLKIISTTLSFVSGTPGGMFAPTLFIGAMLGGAVGGAERVLFPNLTGSVGTYALVGMGVLFAGFLRAPMTSVFMVLEVSGNYSIIIPVMIANTLAYLISRSCQQVPIFDLLTRQDGLELPSLEEQREESILRVEDAMKAPSIPVIDGALRVQEAMEILRNVDHAQGVLVRHESGGWALLHWADLERAAAEGKQGETLDADIPSARLPQLYPDYNLDTALRYVQDSSVVPVVHRANPRELLGVVTLKDILEAYEPHYTENRSPASRPPA